VKVLKIFLVTLLIFIIVIVVFSFGYLKFLLPKVDGEVASTKIIEGAEVIRDKYGVPHIYADNNYDLYFALGYVQAQDRLFQMDFYRRAASGCLSEVLGSDLIDADRYLRTMGFTRTAEEQIKDLTPEMEEIVTAFSDGINAFIDEGKLPVEFKILGYKPKTWNPEDSQAIGNLISFQLASWAYGNEILNLRILNKLGPDLARTFFPAYPKDGIFIMTSDANGEGETKVSEKSKEFLDFFINRTFASNNWVVSGAKSVTGKPILAEDSHEGGPEMPTQWHLSHIVGKDIDVAGAMFPGAPIYIFGHNSHIGWGVTNFDMDEQDLYFEEINPKSPYFVKYKGEWVKLTIIKEKIPVKDDDAEGGFSYADVVIRITPHGPIINDIEDGLGDKPISIKRMGAEPWPLMESFYLINSAKNWDDFKAALAVYAVGPQHFVYADIEGNIGYIGAGKCPIRTNSSGILPTSGADGKHEWRGYYPFDMMPMLFNPEKGYIATSNNPPYRGDSPIFLSSYWESPYRAERSTEMLEAKEKFDIDDMIEMHLDVKSKLAEKLIPIFVASLSESANDKLAPHIESLSSWDCFSTADSEGAAIFHVLQNRLMRAVFLDELGDELFEKFLNDKSIALNTLSRLVLFEVDHPLFDDITTDEKETFYDTLFLAFNETIDYLTEEMGKNPNKWNWGTLHKIEFSHVFGGVAPLRPLFNYGPFPFEGSDQSLNRGGYNKNNALKGDFKVDITASIRYIVDFSDLGGSLMVLSTGQSGNIFSSHRNDMADLFLRGEYCRWYIDREDFESGADGILKFVKVKSVKE